VQNVHIAADYAILSAYFTLSEQSKQMAKRSKKRRSGKDGIKFPPTECSDCHEMIPSDTLFAHRREKHDLKKMLVKSSESSVKEKRQESSEKEKIPHKGYDVTLTSLRGRLVSGGYVYGCFNCCISVTSAWKYRTTEGNDLYLCSLCKEKIIIQQFGYGAPKNGMWSRMVVTNFETNRRKH